MSDQPNTTEEKKLGRPTKYNKELLEKAGNYIHLYEELDEVCPTIEGLALYIGISRETLYRWCGEDDKKDFNDTVRNVTQTQKIVLINKGLAGKFNSKITQLLLGANHSVIEKVSQEVSGPGGKPIENKWEISFVDAKEEKE